MPALVAEPGMPIWLDLATTDIAAAQDFYGPLFDWEFEVPADGADGTGADSDGAGNYVIAKRSGMPVAGFGQIPAEGNTSVWGLMIYAPQLETVHKNAVKAGATSVLEPRNLGNRGDMSVLIDPAGATIGLKSPADEQAFFAAGEPGTPVWHELMIGKNFAETTKFYHELCGWDIKEMSNTEDFHYATAEWEGNPLAGLWDTANLPDSPSMWTLYMGVRNVDEALKLVEAHGGTIVRPAFDSEFGRMATIQDPTGAVLNLTEVEEYTSEMDEVHEPDLFAPDDYKPF